MDRDFPMSICNGAKYYSEDELSRIWKWTLLLLFQNWQLGLKEGDMEERVHIF